MQKKSVFFKIRIALLSNIFPLIIFHLKDRATSRIQFLNGLQTEEYFCLDNQHHFLQLSNVYRVPLTQLLNQPVPIQYVNSHGSSAHHTSSTIKLNIYSKTYLVEFEYCSQTHWLRWIRNCQKQFSQNGITFLLLILLCNYCVATLWQCFTDPSGKLELIQNFQHVSDCFSNQ